MRYLLRFVGNHERIEPVRDLLKDTAAEIAKRPLYLAEQEFCDDAQQQVIALGVARANRDDAAVRSTTNVSAPANTSTPSSRYPPRPPTWLTKPASGWASSTRH